MTVSPKYINPLSDLGFKRLLSPEHKPDQLRALLNALLPADRQIETLSPLQQEAPAADVSFERTVVYDLACVDERGRKFIVEVQRLRAADLNARLLFYGARQISSSMRRGQGTFEYPDVVVVAILDFPVDQPRAVSRVELRRDDGALWSEKLSFVIASLGNFDKPESELATAEDEWLFLLKNLEDMTEVPERYQEDSVFREITSNAEWAKLSPRDRDRYDMWWLEHTKRYSETIGMQKLVAKQVTERVTEEVTERVTEQVTERVTEQFVLRLAAKGLSHDEIAEVAEIELGRVREIIASAR